LECCVDNHDVFFVEVVPAHYDGALEVLLRAPDEPRQLLAGALETLGRKVRLCTLSLADALYDHPELPVEVRASDPELQSKLQARVAAWRRESQKS
jgi:hypothetical protein